MNGCADEDEPVSFTYDDPYLWGDLRPEWKTCKTGQQQSPMEITPENMVTDPKLGELHAHYTKHPILAKISINPGSAIEVQTVRID